MTLSQRETIDMTVALTKVASKFYNEIDWFIDNIQGKIFNHIHWHARPKSDDRHDIYLDNLK